MRADPLSMSPDIPPPPKPRYASDDEMNLAWQDVPYMVVPPLTARPLGHLAVKAFMWFWNGRYGDTTMVEVRTRCGATMRADRSNGAWVALCKRCFPNQHLRGGVADE